MPTPLQFETPTALQFFESLVAEDASLSLIEAAASIAQDVEPGLDTQAVLADIDTLAERLRRRIPGDAAPLQKLRFLNRFFFHELGFAGNVNNFYDPENSFLHKVLRTRRGIPISLALIYIELATQVGLRARGVSFPGHFLVKLSLGTGGRTGEAVIDPLTGHSLSREELDGMLTPYKRRQGLTGDFDAPLGLFLQTAPPREVMARMLRNLKEIYRTADDWPRLVQVLNRLVILLPQALEERRDRGFALAEMGLFEPAIIDLEAYLQPGSDTADRAAVSQRLAALRELGRRRFH